jgi:3-phytase
MWKALIAGLVLLAAAVPRIEIRPALATQAVATDPDDPAIWVNAAAPESSLILGTNKTPAPEGALVVYGLDGRTRQIVRPLDRPNNVDVEYGFPLGAERIDIAVLTERLKRRLRVFRVSAQGVKDISGNLAVFTGETGESGAPMGIALYKRPRDGAVFAIVGRKTGPVNGYLWQYRLEHDGAGRVRAAKVREFGRFSGKDEIEAIAVDDALGHVYYADESDGIHKWHADPDHPQAARELAHFGRDGFKANREGIGIYARPDGTGYIVCSDQLPGSSEFHVFAREGHTHPRLKIARGGADSTDGLEVIATPFGPRFPNGLMVAMNSAARNFLLYDWRDLARTGSPRLSE